ncbi:MAG: hypothetical protein JSW11_00445 [Candidatus Heimdallarchaeota archaeon]|nr:MAG: hypothetical protein JSW11_00445 [Candidatus Heimdallarchaeota archaeon]
MKKLVVCMITIFGGCTLHTTTINSKLRDSGEVPTVCESCHTDKIDCDASCVNQYHDDMNECNKLPDPGGIEWFYCTKLAKMSKDFCLDLCDTGLILCLLRNGCPVLY